MSALLPEADISRDLVLTSADLPLTARADGRVWPHLIEHETAGRDSEREGEIRVGVSSRCDPVVQNDGIRRAPASGVLPR